MFTKANVEAALFYNRCVMDDDFGDPQNSYEQEIYDSGEEILGYPEDNDQPLVFLVIMPTGMPIGDCDILDFEGKHYALLKEGHPLMLHPDVKVIG